MISLQKDADTLARNLKNAPPADGTAAVLGVAALVAAIVTMVTLFKLKREIAEKTERMD